MLIEKGELTSGSTWHAAGQCPSFIGDYNMAKIHHYSNTLYPKLEELTGQYVSWHGGGGLRIATTPEEVSGSDLYRSRLKLQQLTRHRFGQTELNQASSCVA